MGKNYAVFMFFYGEAVRITADCCSSCSAVNVSLLLKNDNVIIIIIMGHSTGLYRNNYKLRRKTERMSSMYSIV